MAASPEEFEFHRRLGFFAVRCNKHVLSEGDIETLDRMAQAIGYAHACEALTALEDKWPPGARFPAASHFADAFRNVQRASDEAEAEDAVARIFAAVGKKGRYWAGSREEKSEYLGTLAMAIVDRIGGWARVCEEAMFLKDLKILRPQWRVLGRSVIERARLGLHETPPELPKPHNQSRLSEASKPKMLERADFPQLVDRKTNNNPFKGGPDER